MARLNVVLTRDEFWCPHIVAVVRLLMLTGCRVGEITSLEWDWITGKRIFLPGFQVRAAHGLALQPRPARSSTAIPRYSADCPYLFPNRPPTRPINNIAFHWDRIRNEAGLPGVRLHDLRHTWASVAAMNGVDMVTVAKLLESRARRDDRTLHSPVRPVRYWRRRPCVGAHFCGGWRGRSGKGRESSAMPRVDLTARLARESKPPAQGHGPVRQDAARLRAAHPPLGPQGLDHAGPHRRPEPPHRHRPIRGNAACRGPPPRLRHACLHPCRTESRRGHQAREADAYPSASSPGEYLRRSDPHWKASGRRTCAHLPQGPHPAHLWQDAAGPHRPRKTWPRGSTRRARTSPVRPTAPSKSCAR